MVNLKSVPLPNRNCIIKDLGEDTILISEKDNLIHTLDEVGAVIWKLIDGKRNLGAILDAVCAEFEVDRKEAEDDLFPFMDELEDIGLIEME
jgi:hypothetical protein